MREAVIVDAVRTPVGKGRPGGALSGWHPVDLLAETLQGLVERAGIDPATIDDVVAGCVSQVGEQSVNIARNAVLAAGFPESVPAATVDRQCGSSQQALHMAAQAIVAGSADVVVAAGVEVMSRVRMGAPAAGADPFGPRIARRYPGGLVPQGISAELIASRWALTREELDAFAVRSHERAAAAADAGRLAGELLPVAIDRGTDGSGTGASGAGASGAGAAGTGGPEAGDPGDPDDRLTGDEGVRRDTTLQALAKLPPAFRDEAWADRFPQLRWVIHAGNASQISDGAAAVLVMERSKAAALGLVPRAAVRAMTVVGDDPILMLTGVIPATRRVLARAGLTIDDVDVFEVNEAFAPVVLAWQHDTGADPDRVNVRGGAIANGHPLGASGAKLLTTLLGALEDVDGDIGLQTMCEGGGMANATVVERLR